MTADTTALQIRIAVLETQLQHANSERAAALAAAQQTISTLTTIIHANIQNQDHDRRQNKYQNPALVQDSVSNDHSVTTINKINGALEIELLRQHLRCTILENEKLKARFSQVVHSKADTIADTYMRVKDHEDSPHLVKGNRVEIGTEEDIKQDGRGLGILTQDKKESFDSLIGDEFSMQTVFSTDSNGALQNLGLHNAPQNYDETDGTASKTDFQPLEDVLGPEAGVVHRKYRSVECQPAPPRYENYRGGIGGSFRREGYRGYKDCDMKPLAPIELQYGDEINTATPTPTPTTIEDMEPQRKFEKSKIQGSNKLQSENENDGQKQNTKAVSPVAIETLVPKLSILKAEESMERSFAGGTYEYSPNKAGDRHRESNGEIYRHREPCYRRHVAGYADIDYAPPQRTSVIIPRRQRALERYDFTPSGVPEFGFPKLSVPLVATAPIIPVSAPGLTPTPKSSPFVGDTDDQLDTTVFSSREERRAAIQMHTSKIGPGDNVLPAFFRHGLRYNPSESDSNYLRTVHVGNLPAHITTRALLARVRGGAVLKATICNTIPLTGWKSALLVFLADKAATEYAEFANKHGISFPCGTRVEGGAEEGEAQRGSFTLLNTPTWPMHTDIISQGRTRVLCVANVRNGMSSAKIKYALEMGDTLVHDGIDEKGRTILAFSSERAATTAMYKLAGLKIVARTDVTFGEDPCAGPLSDLLMPRIRTTVDNKDEIKLDDEEAQNANSGGDVAKDRDAVGESKLDWADEMNELAAGVTRAVNT